MAAACRRALMLSGYKSRIITGLVSGLGACSSVARGLSPCSSALCGPYFYHGRSGHTRHVFHNNPKSSGKGVTLVRKMEAQGIHFNQAKTITSIITEVPIESLENMTKSHQSQDELQKVRKIEAQGIPLNQAKIITSIITEFLIDNLENPTKYDQLQDELQKENLQRECAKLKTDVNRDIDRLHVVLSSMIHKEISDLRASFEVARFGAAKFFTGSIVSLIALGLGLASIMK